MDFSCIFTYMSIKNKINTEDQQDVRINLIVPKHLRKKYKTYCLSKDIGMSERIRELIELDLGGKV